jgi:hypothetical protein
MIESIAWAVIFMGLGAAVVIGIIVAVFIMCEDK